MVRVIVVLVAIVACGSGDERGENTASGSNTPVQASPDPDHEVVERGIRAMAAISDLATKHGADCDALARDLAAHAQREANTIRAFKSILTDPAKQQAITARFGDRIQQVGRAAVAALRDHCATHRAVLDVFKQLE